MSVEEDDRYRDWVGPVLQAGTIASAVIEALTRSNPGLTVVDRGAYVRVLSPNRCLLDRKSVEALLGCPFCLPTDLERIMPAFRGALTVGPEQVLWEPYGVQR